MKRALMVVVCSLVVVFGAQRAHAQWQTQTSPAAVHYDAGNVGIGTGANPPAKFVVVGNGAERLRVNADGRIVFGAGVAAVSTGEYFNTLMLNPGAFNYFRLVGGGSPSLAGIVYDRTGSTTGYLHGFNNDGLFRMVPIAAMGEPGITAAKDGYDGLTMDGLGQVSVGRPNTNELGLYSTRLTVGGASTFNYVRIVGGSAPSLAGIVLDRTGQETSTGYLNGFDNDGRLRIAPVAVMNQDGVTAAKDGVSTTVNNVTFMKRDGITIAPDGRVGIGKAPETADLLYVAGGVKVDGNIAAKYQDVAEWVASDEDVEPGTVVVLSRLGDDRVTPSRDAYDTAVAGVVSHIPGLILGEGGAGKEQIATTGRVKVKVDATAAPIRIGDLLVTSGKPGMAMKSMPVDIGRRQMHQPGTILGKALQPLDGGTGTILVLLSLQ